MFDVGFSEICLVGLVSLLVIGPEKLPQVARFVGFWIGKVRRMVSSVQQEFKENLYAEEVRQLMQQQSEIMAKLEMDSKGAQNLVTEEVQRMQTGFAKTFNDLNPEQPSLQADTVTEPPPKATVVPRAQTVPPLPPLKRSKSKQQHRHGKK
ncbi:MAG: twin-arginine translocase subunit TatB [Methylococcaceae bacterium]|nr:twin-arginine translocase subunit TatB [Methylococcaceae bacterium]